MTLVLVDDFHSDESTSDLLNEFIHKRESCIKLISGSTKLNIILGDELTNAVREADLLKLFLL